MFFKDNTWDIFTAFIKNRKEHKRSLCCSCGVQQQAKLGQLAVRAIKVIVKNAAG